MLLKSVEDEAEREDLKRAIFNEVPPESTLDWEDEDWVPPWFGNEEQNSKEAQAFAAWTRKVGAERS